MDDVAVGLAQLERYFVVRGDRRGVFAGTYRESTDTLRDWLRRGLFEDADSTARLAVAFANAYRQALADNEAGRPVPEAWRIAFDRCRVGDDTLAEDLVLGINAHINYDLPFAVLHAGMDVHRDSCHRDYTRINDALADATPRVRRLIVANYKPGLKIVDLLIGRGLDPRTARSFAQARENSWVAAEALLFARSASEKSQVRMEIADRAGFAARRIEGCKMSPVRCLDVLADAGSHPAAGDIERVLEAPHAGR